MKRTSLTTAIRIGASIIALAGIGAIVAPAVSYSETPGQERRGERQDAQDTRQTGRDAARDEKQECREGDEKSRAECRQEKRATKQGTREDAREKRQGQ